MFSFVWFFTNYSFKTKKSDIVKLLADKIETFEVPSNFSAQNIIPKIKIQLDMDLSSFVFFCLHFTNLLFTGKQKKVTKFLMARIKTFKVPNIFWLKKIQKKPKKQLCFLLFTFLQITCLQANK